MLAYKPKIASHLTQRWQATAAGPKTVPAPLPAPRPAAPKTPDATPLSTTVLGQHHDARLFLSNPSGPASTPLDLPAPVHAAIAPDKLELKMEGVSANTTRGGLGLQAAPFNVFTNLGATGAGFSQPLGQIDTQSVQMGVDAFGARTFAGLAPSLKCTDVDKNMTAAAFGFVKSTHVGLQVAGFDRATGMATLVYEYRADPAVSIDPSHLGAGLGEAFKLGLAQARQVRVRRHLPAATVARLLHKLERWRFSPQQAASRAAVALGWQPPPIAVPSLDDPLAHGGKYRALKPGDTLSVVQNRTLTVGAAGAMAGVRAGAVYSKTDDLRLDITPLRGNILHVIATPQGASAISGSVDVLAAEAYDMRSQAHASQREYFFDMAQPSAAQAYRRAVNGGPLPDMERLPAGVRGGATQHVVQPRRSQGFGTPTPFFLPRQLKIAGLGRHVAQFAERHESRQGNREARAATHGCSKEVHVLWRGISREQAAMRVSEAPPSGGALPPATLQAAYTLTRDTAHRRNRLLSRLQRHFGVTSDTAQVPGRGQSFNVQVQRKLDGDDLQILARSDASTLRAAADASGTQAAALTTLVEKIAAATNDPRQQLALVQAYLTQHGVAGIGAIHRLLGGSPDALHLTTHSSAYEEPLQQVAEIELMHTQGQPLPPAARRRAEKLRQDVQFSREALAGDGLLNRFDPSTLVQRQEALKSAEAVLDAVLRDSV